MRRTQLYLDDQLWGALHVRAQRENTTISELVRQAVRERYVGSHEQRVSAMLRFVGIRKHRPGDTNAIEEFRRFRKGSRIERLAE